MNVIGQRRRIFLLLCSLKVYTVILFYYVIFYQRIPQLAHSLVTQ